MSRQPENHQYLRAHQYLYYVLAQPVLSDQEFDRWGRDNDLDYKGGSDNPSDYTEGQVKLAQEILRGARPPLP